MAKVNHSISDATAQLPLFNNAELTDDRPLPLIVADKWSFVLNTIETNDGLYYSVRHWLVGLTNSKNVDQLIYNYRHRGLFSKNALSFEGEDYLTAESLYRLTQDMRATKKRPAVAAIKDYLAAAGVFADKIRRDPELGVKAAVEAFSKKGFTPERIDARVTGVIKRTALTNALRDCVRGVNYAEGTNHIYLGLCDHTAVALRKALRVPNGANLRDYIGTLGLQYISLAENLIAEQIASMTDLDWSEALRIIDVFASMVGEQAQQSSAMLGRDVFTNQPLLKERN